MQKHVFQNVVKEQPGGVRSVVGVCISGYAIEPMIPCCSVWVYVFGTQIHTQRLNKSETTQDRWWVYSFLCMSLHLSLYAALIMWVCR